MTRILIVDDSEAIRAIVTDMLKQFDSSIDIMLATNGIEGVTLAESAQPEVVLLDWSMPYMNGLLAAQHLRHSPFTQHIPLIAMTPEQDLKEVSEHLSGLSASLLHKPFNLKELMQSLQAANIDVSQLAVTPP